MDVPGRVDVIVPTYNRASLCRAAVESVLAQTYPNVMAIVVDDGSEDDTQDRLRGLGDRVTYIRQANAGVTAARNTGLEAARGEFVAFLDSDDTWLPWKLDAQIHVLRALPDAGMVWTDMAAIDEHGVELHPTYLHQMYTAYRHFRAREHFQTSQRLGECWPSCPADLIDRPCFAGDILPWMFMGNLVQTSTVLLRRQRQLEVGLFNTELAHSGEDYEYHLRTCAAGPVAYIDASSIRYRVGASDQLTADSFMVWMARNNMRTVEGALAAYGDRITLPDHMIRARLAESHFWLGRTEIWRDRRRARRHFRKSMSYAGHRLSGLAYYLLSLFPTWSVHLLRGLKRAAAG